MLPPTLTFIERHRIILFINSANPSHRSHLVQISGEYRAPSVYYIILSTTRIFWNTILFRTRRSHRRRRVSSLSTVHSYRFTFKTRPRAVLYGWPIRKRCRNNIVISWKYNWSHTTTKCDIIPVHLCHWVMILII